MYNGNCFLSATSASLCRGETKRYSPQSRRVQGGCAEKGIISMIFNRSTTRYMVTTFFLMMAGIANSGVFQSRIFF